ncbi:unannotated protein [freshwater metagenome]|uniref:Unannotated protein n=1 Tax=freshwater metagenome TaxID=449393 RepID=A0A6J7D067_9ZZZZ
MNENGVSAAAFTKRPPPQASYWVTVFANPPPSLTITLPFQPNRPPTAMETRMSSKDTWNTRFPVSRRYPFSAAIQPESAGPDTTRQRRPLRKDAASASTAAGSALTSVVTVPASRSRRLGAAGGGASIAFQCCLVRGSTQPISEMNSRRYTAANQGDANTSKNPRDFRTGPHVGDPAIHSFTLRGSLPCWGRTDPGMLAMASRKSRMRAVFMLVSWRQAHRSRPTPPNGGSGALTAPSRNRAR